MSENEKFRLQNPAAAAVVDEKKPPSRNEKAIFITRLVHARKVAGLYHKSQRIRKIPTIVSC